MLSLTVIAFVTAGFVSTCNAAHGHRHDSDAVGRFMHKSTASSGSSQNISSVHSTGSSAIILPQPTLTAVGSSCFDAECHSPNATSHSKISTYATPVPQLQIQTLEFRQDVSVATPTRRRFRSRLTHNYTEYTVSNGSGLASSQVRVSVAKSESLAPTTAIGSSYRGMHDVKHILDVPGEVDFSPHVETHALSPRQDNSYQSFVLGPFPQPTSSSAAPSTTPSSICPAGNGTTYTSEENIQYQIICDIDFLDNDYPYKLVDSFGGCVQKCDAYNYMNHRVLCLAALWVPSREGDANDCYLKSSVAHPSLSTLHIEGALRLTGVEFPLSLSKSAAASTSSSAPTISNSSSSISSTQAAPRPSSSTYATSSSTNTTLSASSPVVSATASSGSSPGVTYASGDSVIVPKVAGSHLQGPTENTPSKQYIDIETPAGSKLANSLLTVGVNGDLSTGYDISLETGVLEVNISTQSHLTSLSNTPHLSRDGGRGGSLNGQHLFIFCDSGSYTPPTSSTNGNFLGFVSSSVAIDTGMNGLVGNALYLQDGIGEWSDKYGRMRGFSPLTDGEQAYNQAMQGQGHRYAIWPESSIIPVDATTGIIYAPIVYDNVNMATKAAVFTYTGATLLTITAGGKGGPVAQRTVEKIFDQDEVEWGCAGGIRSWGSSGIGGDDGSVYVFGNIVGGILIGRTSPTKIGDRNSFEYWNGKGWDNQMPPSSSKAFFIEGPFMDIDVFYSPRHLTFIIVYMTAYADSTFYYRYLKANQCILPPFAPGGDSSSDYVENLVKYSWSDEIVLYKAATGLSGKYIYSGGVHQGYYGSNDIVNGGSKMLLSWTAPTGQDPSSTTSEYQIITAEIDWV